MRRWVAALTAVSLLLNSLPALAQTTPPAAAEVRLYLTDGSVVTGQLISRSKDLIVVRSQEKIFTFEPTQVEKIVTPESLGSGARTITVMEFPYISFLGGTVAFGLLSWVKFDTAAKSNREADLNKEKKVLAHAQKLRDKADRAIMLGWGSALLATGSMAVALYPHKATRRVFPELSLETGAPILLLSYSF
ncbi:MAG: hypothetical protein EXS58_15755 [Candidatus Latescibacteria bacterium]|nr:hypothetical protein [Candidatus Latescibacterota bacterium]